MPNTLVEVWQANSSGRYPHKTDQHNAPLDPELLRRRPHRHRRRGPLPLHHHPAGRVSLAQPLQRLAPGAHPFLALRPGVPHAHGDADVFPGRSAAALRPDVHLHRRTKRARNRLVSVFDWETTIPEQALGYRFDIVLRGREETPMEKMP